MRKIFELLPEGRENAISRRDLMTITGLNDRELRKTIAAERRAGALILSSTDSEHNGYFRPASADELRRFVASMTRRGKATFAAVAAARKALKQIEAEQEGKADERAETRKATGRNDLL
ncbi:MAG: hypothetical protein E7597_03915 [Ruminococcaceae bacterium]|nr:hypothetical protein [Oscillospiraceae bacterium]